jgi:hypothetical protein
MPDITGLPALVDGIAAYLQAQNVTAVVELGWRKNVQQVNQGEGTANRIIVQPGDPAGDAGELADPRQAGYGPRAVWPPDPNQTPDDVVGRELADWAEIATVFIWAVDAEAPEDDRRQYIAIRSLLQSFRQAAQAVARQSLDVGRLEWVNIENVEKQYGRELALSIVVHAPLFDLTPEIAHPSNVAVTGQFVTTQ